MNTYQLPTNDSHFITPDEAITMIGVYRDMREQLLKPEYSGQNILCNSETFTVADVQAVLNQPGCKGLRIYYGMKPDLTIHAILVATDAAGKDLVKKNKTNGDEDDLILEEGKRCPPQCSDDDLLNG